MILPMTTHLPPTTRAVAAAVPDAHDVSPCAPEADATTHGPDECSGMEPHTHAGMRLAEGMDICWCGRETYAYYPCGDCA